MFKAVAKPCTHRAHRVLSNQRGHVAPRNAYRRGLRYEPLEDRCLLSVSASSELLGAYQIDPNVANAQDQVASLSSVVGTVGTVADKTITISAIDNLAGEPSNNGTYRISRTGSTTNALAVDFSVGGDAVHGDTNDYVLRKGTTLISGNTVSIDAGQTYVDVTLEVINDGESELTETASLTLQSKVGYEVGTANTARVTIADNDPIITTVVTVSAMDDDAGEPSNTGTYRISRSGIMTSGLSVEFVLSGDAVRGNMGDYVLKKGTTLLEGNVVTINANQSYVDVTLEAINDTELELTETATLTIQGTANYEIGTPDAASINIADDDRVAPATISVLAIDDAAGEPSNSGTYRISRTGITTSALAINFTTAGDALRGATNDYVLKKGTTLLTGNTVTIDAGQSYVDVMLEVVDNTTPEAEKTSSLTLATGTGYEIGAAVTASISVADDDAVVIAISATDADAGEPSSNGVYRITRGGSADAAVTVNFSVSGDAIRSTTGLAGDYVLKNGSTILTGNTVTIEAGQSYVDITVVVIDDAASESTETATLTIEAGDGYAVVSSLSAVSSTSSNTVPQADTLSIDAQKWLENMEPYLVSVDSPDNHVVSADAGYAGVGKVVMQATDGTYSGSGTLLAGTNWLLTAAHVVCAVGSSTAVAASKITMYFDLPTGRVEVPATQVIVHPSYNDDLNINDVALVQLQFTPTGLEGFEIYTGSDEIGQMATLVGYGRTGTGATGETTTGSDLKRQGQNRYDTTATVFGGPSTILMYDFDNGLAENDAFGVLYNIDNLDADIGINEVCGAHGDSGGAWFIDGKVAGVVSFGRSVAGSHDVLAGTNSSFGDFGGDTRVSAFADWIESIAVNENAPGNIASISITDNDPIVLTVSATDSTVGEPSDNGTFRITRTGNTNASLTVNFAVGGDAERGTDYVLRNGTAALAGSTVTLAAGQSYVDITLDVEDDTTAESAETASLTLKTGTGYEVGVSSSTAITIADNDQVAITVSAFVSDAGEPYRDGVFRFSRTGSVTLPLTIDFTMGGTATRGVDYNLVADWTAAGGGTVVTGNTVMFKAGASTGDLTLVILDDGAAESTETVTLTLNNGTSIANSATVTIADDDSLRQIVGNLGQEIFGTASQIISIPVNYSISNNDTTLSGLGLRLHYNSQFMTFNSLSSLLQTGLVSQQTPVNDTADLDGFSSTDKYILVAWADLAGNWPNQTLPSLLYVGNFTLADGLTDGEQSVVNFTAASTAAGYTFEAHSVTVAVATTNLDVDGNGQCDALTDGVLMMRYLFDPNGPWTTAGAIGSGATQTTHDQVKAYLDAGQTMLDVDGNGQCDALTDGMLMMRYLFDPAGTWTTDGLTGTGATRTTQAQVKAFLDLSYVPQPAPGALSQQESGLTSSLTDSTMISSLAETVQNQIVTPSQTELSVTPGTHATFDVNYSTNPTDPTLSGLGLRMYYNSSLLTFNSLSNVLTTGNISQQAAADDTADADGDPNTDKYVLVAWADMSQNWPAATSQRLYSADFTLKSDATTATQVNFGASSTAAGWTFASTPVTITPTTVVEEAPNLGPTISGVMVVEETGIRDGAIVAGENLVLTFNAADPEGVAGGTLYVDGQKVLPLGGPYIADSGANFCAVIGRPSAGTHSYSIVATDKLGNVTATAHTGTFSVLTSAMHQLGPTISGVMVVEETQPRDGVLTANERLVLTFNAADPDGVAGGTLLLDGKSVASIYGPYVATSGANFAVFLGTQSAGTHSYTIVATDKAGNLTGTEYTGTITVAATVANVGPTISGVSVLPAQGLMSWNVLDSDGVASASLTIDGVTVSQVYGPYAAASGVNFLGVFGTLSAGSHDYVVTATDRLAKSSQYTGTLTVAALNDSPAAQRVDLLTAVMHEMEPVLGYEHSDSVDLMYPTLSLGTRRSLTGLPALSLDTGDRLVNTSVLDHILASFDDSGRKKSSVI